MGLFCSLPFVLLNGKLVTCMKFMLICYICHYCLDCSWMMLWYVGWQLTGKERQEHINQLKKSKAGTSLHFMHLKKLLWLRVILEVSSTQGNKRPAVCLPSQKPAAWVSWKQLLPWRPDGTHSHTFRPVTSLLLYSVFLVTNSPACWKILVFSFHPT